MRPIVRIPNAVLSKPSKPVVSFDKKLQQIIHDMKTTLRETTNPKGVGLAAPQIGIGLRIFLTRPTEKSAIRVFINPEIIHADSIPEQPDKNSQLEGCLSIPTIWGVVKRSPSLTLSYQDEQGEKHEETFSGFMATIIQHETDHINGVLFTQRVLEQKTKLYQNAHDEKGKEILEEISI